MTEQNIPLNTIPPALSDRLQTVMGYIRGEMSILPPRTVTNASMLMVISIMCYLAILTLSGVLSLNAAASGWTSELARTLTVQLSSLSALSSESETSEREIEKALTILNATEGVVSATPIRRDEAIAMLEPWLGEGNISDDLPVPQLIEVTLSENAIIDIATLETTLQEDIPDSKIDDHTQWNEEILVFAEFLKSIAALILTLIILSTIAIIVFATRAGLEARQDIVEVLHLIGARDEFIATEFQKQFFHLGLKASIMALIAAFVTLLFISITTGIMSPTSTVTLIPPLTLSWSSLLSVLLVPLLALLVILVTARMTVLHVLRQRL